MTAPEEVSNETTPVLDGTDVAVEPADLDDVEVPATSDPDQMTDDDLGGVAGQGGAG